MKTTKKVKGKGKQNKVKTGEHATCKSGHIVKVERIEILFSEKGNIVSTLEDLDEHKIQINPVVHKRFKELCQTLEKEQYAL